MISRQRDMLVELTFTRLTWLYNLSQRCLLAVEPEIPLLFFGAVTIYATRLENTLNRLGKVHLVLRPAIQAKSGHEKNNCDCFSHLRLIPEAEYPRAIHRWQPKIALGQALNRLAEDVKAGCSTRPGTWRWYGGQS